MFINFLRVLIVYLFYQDGDIAPLDKIVELAKKYKALVMIDECHAAGFLGKGGKGTPEIFNVLVNSIIRFFLNEFIKFRMKST